MYKFVSLNSVFSNFIAILEFENTGFIDRSAPKCLCLQGLFPDCIKVCVDGRYLMPQSVSQKFFFRFLGRFIGVYAPNCLNVPHF